MPLYEHIFVARRDISSQQVDNLAQSYSKIITDGGGTVTKVENWGLRNLAYRIKKNRKGHYILMNIDSPFPPIAEVERNERINDDIIRFLTIRVDELDDEPSMIMQNKTSRDERVRRDSHRGGDDRSSRPVAKPAVATQDSASAEKSEAAPKSGDKSDKPKVEADAAKAADTGAGEKS